MVLGLLVCAASSVRFVELRSSEVLSGVADGMERDFSMSAHPLDMVTTFLVGGTVETGLLMQSLVAMIVR